MTRAQHVDPRTAARSTTVENVHPGMWWLGLFEDGPDWVRCATRFVTPQEHSDRRVVQLRGVGTDGKATSLIEYADHVVRVLDSAQARAAGLEVRTWAWTR